MVPRAGFEPATFRLGGGRSILLSYRGPIPTRMELANSHHRNGGADGSRTHDLSSAIAALSQLSYRPLRDKFIILILSTSSLVAKDIRLMNDSTFKIRSAREGDIDAIVDFNIALAEESEGRALDRQQVYRGVQAFIRQPDRGLYWVAVEGERILGQIGLTYEWSDWRDGMFWWIQSVYVHPEARGKGVFRKLFDKVRREAHHTKDVCGLRLYVEKDNKKAISIYQSIGLELTTYRVMEQEWAAQED